MNDPESTSVGSAAWKKWISPRRWRVWIILGLLAYTLAGFFGAPWLLERAASKKVAELDRRLSFGDIKINPFLLTLQMLDTQLHDSDGAMLASFDDLSINLQTSSLFRWALTFKEIRLSGLLVNWERFAPGDDRFGRLIDSIPTEGEPEAEVSAEGLPRLTIYQLQINGAHIHVIDHLANGKFSTDVGPIEIQVTDLSSLPNQSGQQRAHIKTQADGEIAWQGSVQLSPVQSAGKVSIKGKVFEGLDHYLAQFTSATLRGEGVVADFDFAVKWAADQSLTVAIEDLSAQMDQWQLFLPDEPEAFVSLPQLQVSGGSLHWPQQTLNLASVSLQQPGLRLVMAADGSLNLDKLLADLAGDDAGAESASGSEGKPWQVGVASFGIEQASVQIDDLRTEPPAQLGLQDIKVVVNDISNQDGASLPVQATFALASGGSGNFDGQIVVLPEFSASGELLLDALQLQVAQPWVNDIARVTLNSGSVSLNGKVAMNPQQPGSFQGSVLISEMDVSDILHQEKLTGWKQLKLDRVEVDLAANTVKTSELDIQQPYGRLQIAADRTTNLDGLMIESATDAAAANPESETAELAITIAGFKIDDASLDFSDLSLPLPFAAAIRSMDGTISTLATNSDEPARVNLEGQVNEFGLARIAGSIYVWSPERFTDIQMTFRNLEMERMTPYIIEFAGWEIDAGRMDLDLDYKINKGQLNGANAVVIRELTVGDKVDNPSGASLPLKFAVALLKDSNGVIDVDLPIEGNVNDPSFQIGGIVWKAIGNLLLKVVTAPFRFLGSLVGVDSEEFGTLHFAAGRSEVSPPDREQLVKLAQAMLQKPELRLEVTGSYVDQLDRPALKTQQLDERIEQGISALQDSEALITEQRREVMERLLTSSSAGVDLLALQQQFSSIPAGEDATKATPVLDETAYLEALRKQLIEAETVTEAALQALAEARADAVVAILSGDGGDRTLSLTRLPAEAANAGDNGEVTLALKVEAVE